MEFTAEQIAFLLNGTIQGDKDTKVNMIGTIEKAKENELTFLSNPAYEKYIYTTKAGIVLVKNGFSPSGEINATLIVVDDPYIAFTKLLKEYEKVKMYSKSGIEEPSFFDPSASHGTEFYLGRFAYVGKNVQLGDNVKIYPNCYIGDNVIVGDNCILYPNVTLYHEVHIGDNCILHSGSVIGSDGFGFAPQQDGTFDNIPQLGTVKLEDGVSIGANTVIDRATLPGEFTLVEKGTKLDNLIQVGHNVKIGKNTVIAAQTGIAGSSKVGNNCMLGGQVGIAGHIEIPNGTKVAAQTGIPSSLKEENTTIMGSPSMAYSAFLKSYSVFRKLPEMYKSLRNMESNVNKKD